MEYSRQDGSSATGDTLLQDARLFAELNVAMTDGLIAIFDSKYLYNFWRPEAAIHAGDADGNPATAGDPTWAPLKPTPAHPTILRPIRERCSRKYGARVVLWNRPDGF